MASGRFCHRQQRSLHNGQGAVAADGAPFFGAPFAGGSPTPIRPELCRLPSRAGERDTFAKNGRTSAGAMGRRVKRKGDVP